jgi:hypothetical protein
MRNDAFSLQPRNSLRLRNDAAQHARRYDTAVTMIAALSPTSMTMLNACGSAFAMSSFRDTPRLSATKLSATRLGASRQTIHHARATCTSNLARSPG